MVPSALLRKAAALNAEPHDTASAELSKVAEECDVLLQDAAEEMLSKEGGWVGSGGGGQEMLATDGTVATAVGAQALVTCVMVKEVERGSNVVAKDDAMLLVTRREESEREALDLRQEEEEEVGVDEDTALTLALDEAGDVTSSDMSNSSGLRQRPQSGACVCFGMCMGVDVGLCVGVCVGVGVGIGIGVSVWVCLNWRLWARVCAYTHTNILDKTYAQTHTRTHTHHSNGRRKYSDKTHAHTHTHTHTHHSKSRRKWRKQQHPACNHTNTQKHTSA